MLPDGCRALSAGHDRTLRLWDLRGLKTAGVFSAGHKSRVNCVDISPDGRLALSGGAEGSVKVWDLSTRECRNTIEQAHGDEVTAVRFDPTGGQAISAGRDKVLRAWAADFHQPTWRIASSAEFAPVAAAVITAHKGAGMPGLLAIEVDGVIRAWEKPVAGRAAEGKAAPGFLHRVRVSADSRRVVWAGAKSGGGVFHRGAGALGIGTPFDTDPSLAPLTGVAVSADGTLAVTIADDSVRCWRVGQDDAGAPTLTRTALLASGGVGERCAAVAVGTASPLVVTGGARGLLTAWDFATGRRLGQSQTGLSNLSAVELSADGRLAVAIGSEGLGVWDLATGQFTSADPGLAGLRCVALHASDKWMMTGGDDGWLRLWELGPPYERPICIHKAFAHRGAVMHVSTGRHYATSVGADRVVKEWEFASGDRLD
jgi:WD40 repeat protein